MGWTSTNVQVKYKNGKAYIDRKEECDKLSQTVFRIPRYSGRRCV